MFEAEAKLLRAGASHTADLQWSPAFGGGPSMTRRVSIYTFIYLSIYLSISLSISIYLSIYLSIYRYLSISI